MAPRMPAHTYLSVARHLAHGAAVVGKVILDVGIGHLQLVKEQNEVQRVCKELREGLLALQTPERRLRAQLRQQNRNGPGYRERILIEIAQLQHGWLQGFPRLRFRLF